MVETLGSEAVVGMEVVSWGAGGTRVRGRGSDRGRMTEKLRWSAVERISDSEGGLWRV